MFESLLNFFGGLFMASTVSLQGSLWDYTLKTPGQQPMPLLAYKDKAHAILLVNIASRCGFTPQLAGLEQLYQDYKDQGLVVIGVPSNDFMGQEPLTDEQITGFCQLNYGVTFPITSKIHVVSGDVDPLYVWLSTYAKPKWNFHKYLFDKNGHLIEAFASSTTPKSEVLVKHIEKLL
jgi:glutathione peroxidase